MVKIREKVLFLFFMGLAGIAVFFLFDRMIIRKDSFLNTRYVDRRFIELMEGLVADNVFKVEKDKIVFDEKALAAKRLGKK